MSDQTMRNVCRFSTVLLVASLLWFSVPLACDAVLGSGWVSHHGPSFASGQDDEKQDDESKQEKKKKQSDSPKLIQAAKDIPVWIDLTNKQVIAEGHICLREGQLEMFACPQHTKEHESIVSVHSPAKFIHFALLAVGAKTGSPVKFDPKYEPASGTVVDVLVQWKDKEGKLQEVNAQEMVKHAKTGKVMDHEWVFAGSGFWADEESGQKYYYADGGELVCLSNFPAAMLDVTVKSSDRNNSLLFVANSEKIPPMRTEVKLLFRPRLKQDAKKNQQADEKKADTKKTDTKKADQNSAG